MMRRSLQEKEMCEMTALAMHLATFGYPADVRDVCNTVLTTETDAVTTCTCLTNLDMDWAMENLNCYFAESDEGTILESIYLCHMMDALDGMDDSAADMDLIE